MQISRNIPTYDLNTRNPNSGKKKKGIGQWLKNKVLRHVNIWSAPPFSILKWVREGKEWEVEGLVEWKEELQSDEREKDHEQ